jgi:Uncharacterized conserved protein (DUF2163)
MRTFLNGSGADSTSAVQAYLAAHRELIPADLFVIGTAPNYQGNYLGRLFLLTSYPSPLVWSYRGTFASAVIERGEVASKIGLEVDTLQITWSPKNSDLLATDGSGNPLLTAIEGFGCGVFDNGTVELWRTLMPAPGDCDTLGACLLFSGRIGNIEPDRLKAMIKVMSRLETLNEMVPTNLIEPTNILAQYTTGQVLKNGPSSFTVLAGSTAQVLTADPVSAPGGYTPANDLWDDGYVVMASPGKLGGSYRGVRQQTFGSHHVFYLYDPLPFAPQAGDTFSAFILVPPDQAGAAAQGSELDAFPYVPSAIDSSVVIA